VALSQALRAAEQAVAGGERDPGRLRDGALAALAAQDVEPEYLALVDPDSFQPVQAVNGRVLVAVAARLGSTRLIDNAVIHTPVATPAGAPTITKEP
jgi:pantoate--beta-alanine ligase